jgi:hypothetical protein
VFRGQLIDVNKFLGIPVLDSIDGTILTSSSSSSSSS